MPLIISLLRCALLKEIEVVRREKRKKREKEERKVVVCGQKKKKGTILVMSCFPLINKARGASVQRESRWLEGERMSGAKRQSCTCTYS